jgi:Spy/CpxP family protein refolding chaperone
MAPASASASAGASAGVGAGGEAVLLGSGLSSLKALEQQLKDIEDQEEKQVRRQEKEDTKASDEVMRCISEISKKYSVKHCRKGGCVKKER